MLTPDPIAPLLRALSRPAAQSSDFDLNRDFVPPAEAPRLRPAAVLVGVHLSPRGLELVLTKRSSRLRHHPGQIAFPGGKLDEDDAGPVAAALREAREEIGLDPANVEVLGELPPHDTVTNFRVTPILARIRADFPVVPEAGEVAEVFRVPLVLVSDPAQFRVESRLWRGQRRSYYVVPYGPYYIWGATARILYGLATRMAE